MSEEITPNDQITDFLLYTTPDGQVKVEAVLYNEDIWLTQKRMAEVFGVTIPTINEHIKNIFKSGELKEGSVVRKFLITASDGKNYQTSFYNLDMIIAVGYRVNSKKATQFRIWATERLKEYIIKGFIMDDDRLKNKQMHIGFFKFKIRDLKRI